MEEVAAVELGRDRYRQPQLAPGGLDPLAVRRGANEVAAESDEGLHLAGDHGLARGHGRESLLERRLDPVELRAEYAPEATEAADHLVGDHEDLVLPQHGLDLLARAHGCG